MANRGPKYGDEKEEDATDAARKYARKQTVSFPCGSVVKSSPATQQLQGDMGSIPRSGISPGGRHGNPLQYSCLENPMDRGGWRLWSLGSQSQTRGSNLAQHRVASKTQGWRSSHKFNHMEAPSVLSKGLDFISVLNELIAKD